ncbi:MAG: cation:proton antiporter [Spirochaetes bacterium]|jgi:multicomponent Na+:H+ antiporter subunit F|nr:cation:proton antiporter [Spirochaetota bacterium]MBP8986599.1 cation:proton antiporter [Spirochaetota bacterium]HOE20798.1 monovalent cation/H+ antiporter complex subunit F [Spirochaetota bacterium]HQL43063.1 monovalent cation/H+ antiporter complex subunit F [Spirochaetota bacterium]HQQ50535.1 monovalent cation/H+ antiporter complex subunit F [Spirochaetota bacterium]
MYDFDLIFLIAGLLTIIYVCIIVIRIAFSHNVPERIVALDTINTLIIVIMIVLGAAQKKALYIDIGIVYGIISFIGTLYIARYLIDEKR